MQKGHIPTTGFPVVLGHEGAGIVRAIGDKVADKSLKVGDQVLLSYTTCQKCDACLEDRPTFCVDHHVVNFAALRPDKTSPAKLKDGNTSVGSQFFGHSSFAKLSVVQDYSVVKCPVPDMLPCYSPLGCGFQTGAGTVLNAIQPTKSARVVIFGLGSVGLAALMAAAHLEVRQLIGVDVVEDRLELAKELGATDVINAAKEGDNLTARLLELTGGVNVAIDCSGADSSLQAAIDCLAYGGSAVSVGIPRPGFSPKVDALSFFIGNKTYRAVIEGQADPSKVSYAATGLGFWRGDKARRRKSLFADQWTEQFLPELIDLHRKGRFPVDKLCKVYSAKDLDKALHDMHTGTVR